MLAFYTWLISALQNNQEVIQEDFRVDCIHAKRMLSIQVGKTAIVILKKVFGIKSFL